MVAGRPTKYREEYCEGIVEYMTTGQSLIQYAASIGVSKHSIYEWAKDHPKFSDALTKAQGACEAYWERVCQSKTLKKSGGSDAVLMFYMKNRFRWTDRQAQDIVTTQSITFTSEIADDGTVKRELEE